MKNKSKPLPVKTILTIAKIKQILTDSKLYNTIEFEGVSGTKSNPRYNFKLDGAVYPFESELGARLVVAEAKNVKLLKQIANSPEFSNSVNSLTENHFIGMISSDSEIIKVLSCTFNDFGIKLPEPFQGKFPTQVCISAKVDTATKTVKSIILDIIS